MSKSIFDSDTSSASDNVITVSGIKILGATKGQILFIGDTNGTVDGLDLGTTNDVLIAGSNGIPEYTNTLNINTITVNDFKINNTVLGDLLQVYGSPLQISRVPIGSPNQILSVGSVSNAVWQNLQSLINSSSPLTIPQLTVSNGFQLSSYPNIFLHTDGSGNIISQRSQYTSLGTKSFNNTPTDLYSNVTWSVVNGAWYTLKINLFTSNTTPFHGTVEMEDSNSSVQLGAFNYDGYNLSTIGLDFVLQNSFPTGLVAFTITAQTTSGTATLSNGTIYLERVPAPIIHV